MEHIEVFAVHNMEANSDATVPVVCTRCGVTAFTSEENLRAAQARGMTIVCLRCVVLHTITDPDEVEIRGSVQDGHVLPLKDV